VQNIFYFNDTQALRDASALAAIRFVLLGLDTLIGYILMYYCIAQVGQRISTGTICCPHHTTYLSVCSISSHHLPVRLPVRLPLDPLSTLHIAFYNASYVAASLHFLLLFLSFRVEIGHVRVTNAKRNRIL
jgi:hypothetical protein